MIVSRFVCSGLHHRWLCLLTALALIAGGLRATAADLEEQAHSLKIVPADAAVYSASLRLKEQIDIVAASKWWQKVQQVPVLQIGLMQLQQAWDAPPSEELQQFRDWAEGEQGLELRALAGEMFADEWFFYADGGATALVEVAVDIQSAMNLIKFKNAESFEDLEGEADEEQVREVIVEMIAKHKDKLQAPNMVLGFRVKDTSTVGKQLDALEEHVRALLEEEAEPLADKLSRNTSSDRDLLVLELPASLIPWDELEEELDDEETFKLIQELLDGKSVCVAVGYVGEFVVLSVCDSVEHFDTWGSSGQLADNPALQRLKAHADEKLTSIGYVSGEFMEAANSQARNVNDGVEMGKALLRMANITSDDREQITSDIEELATDIREWLPKLGATSSVSFLTDRGYEAFSYNWSSVLAADASKPLTLIEHVGKKPAMFVVTRDTSSVEQYDKIAKWAGRILKDAEIVAVSEADEDDWAEYLAAKEQILPLIERLHVATRDHLLPGLEDGQGGVVIDLSSAQKSWCDAMSPAKSALPLPAVSILAGVSDAEHVHSAAKEYYSVAQDALELAHEHEPEDVPEITLPSPEEKEMGDAKAFVFPLDESLEVADEIAPHCVIGPDVAVLGYVPEISEALVDKNEFECDSPVADFDRPLYAAAHVDFGQVLDASKKWIDYGFQIVDEQELDENGISFFVRPQLDQFLELTRSLKSFTSITYFEDGAWVTRSETHIEDVE